ncbi:PD-(D/E)XK nuclease family protein [Pseudonocardia sp. ICBG1142]|uniref:PD-(D/E)XK nuclease family protein n=1 Tax=Pseudonocardia sp. ICBG1142 TaxID=2846760 RepID=UPI0027E18E8E|nr:PD-(D/E)XK nuclease family protein [Pseudonocardia sp. ICBG1142]
MPRGRRAGSGCAVGSTGSNATTRGVRSSSTSRRGRRPPRRRPPPSTHQLAVYQLAASLGAFDQLVGAGVEPGGARLLFLADRKASGEAKEPQQAALRPEEMGHWRDVLMTCAEDSAGAVFVARAGPDCDRCPVRTSCPAVETGRTVVDG